MCQCYKTFLRRKLIEKWVFYGKISVFTENFYAKIFSVAIFCICLRKNIRLTEKNVYNIGPWLQSLAGRKANNSTNNLQNNWGLIALESKNIVTKCKEERGKNCACNTESLGIVLAFFSEKVQPVVDAINIRKLRFH